MDLESKITREQILETQNHSVFKFPPGFLWGTSTSAHQVEGNNNKNDWWQWEKVPGHIADGSQSGLAIDQFNRYRDDFCLARQMSMNAQRISIEWSRIEPQEGVWDEKAIIYYRNVLITLKEQFFSVMVTLFHFTLPQWVAAQGGWENPKTVSQFERFVRKVVATYAPSVDFWITINEPMVFITQSYLYGIWPPGVKSLWRAAKVFWRLASAHRRAYRAIHEIMDSGSSLSKVGIAKNVISFDPYRKHLFIDVWFVRAADWLWNHSFFSQTRGNHDFVGINYYFHYRVAFTLCDYQHLFFRVRNENREVSDVGWEVYPSGIFVAIQNMSRYRKPIYVTENGIASVNDDKRIRFLVAHLKEVYCAIQSGVDVRGYFYWSLLDNFEWEKGFGPRFGLIGVNQKTMERIPKPSFNVYAKIAQTNGITHDLLRFLGHER